ncbi:MAG: DUF1538 domain-containing protein [Gammaproteobacteria bacterium]|jgi:hypothetical protein
MGILQSLIATLLSTIGDVAPIAGIIFGFQLFLLRHPIPNLKRVILGFFFVLLGLACFLQGLERALFPLGRMMAEQLTHPAFLATDSTVKAAAGNWSSYYWVYVFGAAIGFSTTIAEPSLIAVAIKAQAASGGTVNVWGLRVAVALGVAMGIALGTFRIVTGTPLYYYITVGYVLVLIQTLYSPQSIIALAYDSGGVTTSTVTVPLVTALGIGLASNVPGRSPVLDGFGLIAFASLFPIITVLGYAQMTQWRKRRARLHGMNRKY